LPALLAGASLLTTGLVVVGGSSPAAAATTVPFTTQGCSTFTVPTGVTAVGIEAIGAAGGPSGMHTGVAGLGDEVNGTLSGLVGGQVLYVCVDSGGADGGISGFGGGGGTGGGASGVSVGSDFSHPVLIAGGGGGGSGGQDLPGGNAGDPTGGTGTAGASSLGADGGTQAAGGAHSAGTDCASDGTNGNGSTGTGPGTGGTGGDGFYGGGGGGGGYFGGGGAGGSGTSGTTPPCIGSGAGGGGGGSDFCGNTYVTLPVTMACGPVVGEAGTATVAGSSPGDAMVALTYTFAPPTASITTPANGATYAQGSVVNSAFTCTEATGGPGIASCVDQNGNPSGSTINTSTTGPHTYTVTATSSDGLTGTASVTYNVAVPPTASITTPANGATYSLGAVVNSAFICTDGAGGTGIASCLDQNGNPAGSPINTSTTGPHTYTVTATSSDGFTGTASVTYNVVPSGSVDAPGPPLDLTVTGDAITLNWQAPASPGSAPVPSYEVFRFTASTAATQIATVAATTYVDNNVTAGVTYSYYVEAVNAFGTSAPSNIASATATSSGPAPTPSSCSGYSGNAAFVCALYEDILGRGPDSAGLTIWVAALSSGTSTTQVAYDIATSTEYRTDYIEADYQAFLGRVTDPGGTSTWLSAFDSGATDEQVDSGIFGSPEFFTDAGSTNSGFINAVYQDLLGRPADSGGLVTWNAGLSNGMSRTQVAYDIDTSNESRTDTVQFFYQLLLNRPADPGGLSTWVGDLNSGATDEQVLAGIAGSQEFYNDATDV